MKSQRPGVQEDVFMCFAGFFSWFVRSQIQNMWHSSSVTMERSHSQQVWQLHSHSLSSRYNDKIHVLLKWWELNKKLPTLEVEYWLYYTLCVRVCVPSAPGSPLRREKMSDVEEEDTSGSPGSSCLSLKSDRSKGDPPDFSDGPGPSDTK